MFYSLRGNISATVVFILAFLSSVLFLLWVLQSTDPRISPGALEPVMPDYTIVTPEPGIDGFRRHEMGWKPQPYRMRKTGGV